MVVLEVVPDFYTVIRYPALLGPLFWIRLTVEIHIHVYIYIYIHTQLDTELKKMDKFIVML